MKGRVAYRRTGPEKNENEFIFRFNHERGIVQFSRGDGKWYKVQDISSEEINALLGLEALAELQLGSDEDNHA